MSASQEEKPTEDFTLDEFLGRLFLAGWGCAVLSAVFLALSFAAGANMWMAIWLTIARIFGIGGFVIGLIAIFNRRWTVGCLLLLISVGLPFASLIYHGTL